MFGPSAQPYLVYLVSGRDRLTRLHIAAEVWSAAYLLHPAVASGMVDFNRVLREFLPVADKTVKPEDFVAAINERLLKPLNDPTTFAQLSDSSACEPLTGKPADFTLESTTEPDLAIINAGIPEPRYNEMSSTVS